MPTHLSRARSIFEDRRDQVFAVYQPLIAPIVHTLRATLPRNIEDRDLGQTGAAALLSIADHLENYVWIRVRGAILDSVKYGRYREATHSQLDQRIIPIDLAIRPQIDEEIDSARRRDRLPAAIEALPMPERNLIAMKLAGVSTLEIARREGITTRTVKRRKVSALSNLRTILAVKAA